MTTRPTVAIDIDGVIYDIISHIENRYLPPKFQGYRPTCWNCWEEFEITKELFFKYYSRCWIKAGDDFLLAAKYTDKFAGELFDTLHRDGYRISVITKRSEHDIINLITYLNAFKFHYDTLTIITDEQDKKLEYFDVIIDDNPENMPDNSKKKGILISQEWNKNYPPTNPGYRIQIVNSLKDVIPLIHRFVPPLRIQMSSS